MQGWASPAHRGAVAGQSWAGSRAAARGHLGSAAGMDALTAGAAGAELVEGAGSPGCARAVVVGDMLPPNGVLGTQLEGARCALSPLWEQDRWPEPVGSLWMLKAVWQWRPGCHSCWAGTRCLGDTGTGHGSAPRLLGDGDGDRRCLDSPFFPILPHPSCP